MNERPVFLLSDEVINKIAAGEVVERPCSVVKELLENAIDAGATKIEIEAADGGRNLIRVTDNGCGMSRDDALLAVERHATSKIRDIEDIARISTLGFRGEALAAISAVCRFRLQTRPAGRETGTEIVMSGGKLQDVREIGCPPGTSVEARALFFNVPARRRFLRSAQTELAHIRQLFAVYALAHTRLGLTLSVDGRQAHLLPAGASLEERIMDLFHLNPAVDLRPIAHESPAIRMRGYIGLPQQAGSDSSGQMFFINGRPATAAVLHAAVREAYHSLVPKERYPRIFLFLETPAEDVDANVHPTKKEVRFHKPVQVRDAVAEALRAALAGGGAPGRPAAAAAQRSGVEPPQPGSLFPYPPAPLQARRAWPQPASPAAPAAAAGGQLEQPASGSAPWRLRRILGRAGGKYVVMETDDGLTLMDPHAAHERVLYERFMLQLRSGKVPSQGLLKAETIELAPKEAARVRAALGTLKNMGFGMDEFGQDSFVVDAMPACFSDADAKPLLLEIAAALETAGEKRAAGRMLEESVARAACKAAVKAGRDLSDAEIENILSALEAAEMPYTCPHGRPTLLHFSFKELDRRFGRLP